MAFDPVLTGATANDGTGDPLRTAFTRINDNFDLAVEGAASSVDDRVAVFDGVTGKLVKDSGVSIATLTSGLNFAGLWNASTNTPTLTSSVGTEGTYYVVSVAGSTNLNGVSSWAVGESALFTAGVWVKVASSFVSNPGTSTNNAVAVFDGTTGKLLKDGTGTVTAGKFSPTANTVPGNGMYLPAANTVAFSTASVERLRVLSSGQATFGLSAISASSTYGTSQLSVSGNSFTAAHVESHNNTAINGSFLGLMRSRGTQASPTHCETNDLLGALNAAAYQDAVTFPYRTSADIEFRAAGNHSTTSLPGEIRIFTVPSGSITKSERMRVDSAGNVGIGTTSPARPLHVSNVMRLEPRATAPGSPAKGDIYFDSSDDKLKCYDGTAWQNLF